MNTKWLQAINILGIIALIIGAVDPLEGSIAIVFGSALIALSRSLERSDYYKLFIISFIAIAIGVSFMFYFSSLGGFGGDSNLSSWWGLLILPYPLGWLFVISILIYKATRKSREKLNL